MAAADALYLPYTLYCMFYILGLPCRASADADGTAQAAVTKVVQV